MKKCFVCAAMVVVLIGLSVMICSASAENQASLSNSAFTLSTTKMIIAVGDVTYIDFTPIDVELTWTSNNESVVSIDAHTGVLTALKLGSATITATYADEYGTTHVQTCQIRVLREKTDFRNEVYWIQYQNQDRYLFPVVNEPTIGPYMRVVTKNDSSALKWRIQKSGMYYTIKSVQHNMYLGVPTNGSVLSNVPTLYEEVSIYTKWRIFFADYGYIFVPAVMMNGKVMSPGSNQPENAGYVGFFDYFDTTFFKYWNLKCNSTYIVNYYDYSVQYDLQLKNSITAANSFVNQLFDICFSHNLYMDGVATYYGDLTCNSCFCGVDVPCSNSSDCLLHHKNQDVFFKEVKMIPNNRGDVLAMWANHIGNVFCKEDENGNHTIASLVFASYHESRIIFNYFREKAEWNPNVPASLILAHEVGHQFGLPEQYKLDPVGHSDNGAMVCVMQRYGRDRAETFYDYLKGADSDFLNISDAFCDDCMAILTESVEAS